jgi:WD40 repeat protein
VPVAAGASSALGAAPASPGGSGTPVDVTATDPEARRERSAATEPTPGFATPAPLAGVSETVTDTGANEKARAFPAAETAPPTDLPRRGPERYDMRDVHGQGGLGRVVIAYDNDLERIVAVKELLRPNQRSEARFVREAKITARLEHPAIVPVHDAGRFPDGQPFYTMKLVAGHSLKEALAEKQTFKERLELLPNLLAVADAIAYAHSKRIIHRDLKPSNVIIGEYGETVVIDWGLAKDLSVDDKDAPDAGPYRSASVTQQGLTVAGEVVGTPAYMSPEQARGEELDEATDIYSLGALLYELVAGRRPYAELASGCLDTFIETVRRQAPTRVDNLPGGPFPAELIAVIDRALARDPEHRYSSAAEFAADLRRYQSGQLVSAHHYSPLALAGKWMGAHKVLVVSAGVGVAVLAVVGGASLRQILAANAEARQAQAKAEAEREVSIASRDGMILANARAWLESDPTSSLAWTKDYPSSGADLAEMRRIMLTAEQRGVAKHVVNYGDDIAAVAFSPDDTTVAAAGTGGAILLLNVSSGEVERIQTDARFVTSLDYSARGDGLIIGGDGSLYSVSAANGAAERFGSMATSAFLAFSSDRNLVAAPLVDGSIGIWDTGDFRRSLVPSTHANIADLEFVGDGFLASMSRTDSTVHIYDLADHAEHVLEGHNEVVVEMAADRDRGLLATGSRDATVRVWDVRTRRLVHRFEGHNSTVTALAFSPNGRIVAAGDWEGLIVLWDLETGEGRRLLGHQGTIYMVRFSPDGRWLGSVDGNGQSRLWDTQLGDHRAYRGHAGVVAALAFDSRAAHFATVGAMGQLRVWRTPQEDAWARRVHIQRIHDLGISPDDSLYVTGSPEGEAVAWTRDGDVIASIREKQIGDIYRAYPLHDQVILNGAKRIAIWTPLADENLRFLDLGPHEVQATARLEGGAEPLQGMRLAFPSSDGKTLLVGELHPPGRIWLHDLATGASRELGRLHDGLRELRLHGRYAITISRAEYRIDAWDLNNGQQHRLGYHSESVTTIATLEAGRFAVGSLDGYMTFCTPTPHGLDCKRDRYGQGIRRSVPLPRSDRLVVGLKGGDVLEVDPDGFERKLLMHLPSDAHIMDVSPDGRFVAAATGGHSSIWLYDRSRQLVLELRGHVGGVFTMRFEHGSSRLVSAGYDRSLRAWDLENLQVPPLEHAAALEWANERTTARIDGSHGVWGSSMIP